MDNRLGIILMILAMFFFAAGDTFVKFTTEYLSVGQLLLWLGLLATLIFSCIALMLGQAPFSMNIFEKGVLWRLFGEVIGTSGIITSLALNSLAMTSSIQQAVPLVVTFGAVMFLNEKVGIRRWVAILLGFAFVLLILRPGLSGFEYSLLWAVVGVIGLSIRDLATKFITDDVTNWQLSVYGYLVLIPLGLVFIALGDGDYSLPSDSWGPFTGTLATSMLAYFTITASVRVAELSAVVAFRYTRLLFALIFAVIFFDESPDWQTLLGAAGIIASGLFLISRNNSASALPSDKTSG